MILDPNRIYDGFSNLVGGVDGGRLPNLIDQIQCEEAGNCVFRGGPPSTRPAFLDVDLTNETPDMNYGALGIYDPFGSTNSSVNNFNTGLFQEGSYYAPRKGNEYIMLTIGGRLYQVTPGNAQTGTTREIQLARRNRSDIPIGYHLQAENYFIAQDGEGAPIIFDGVAARRAGTDEIFTGTIMSYGMGRIVLISIWGAVYFGDIFDGKGNGAADILGFTETQFLNEGFPSAIPSSMGQPTAIVFIPSQDTATGVGECLISGRRGVESFFLSIPRDQWKDSAFQRSALLGVGITGHRAWTLANQDIWFRSDDGWRSYRQARAETDKWAQIPESTNVRKWVEADSPDLLDYCSTINFQNRLLGTCTPYPNQSRLYHNGLVTLDFDILSSFGKGTVPAWDGHWGNYANSPETGLRVLRLIEGTFNGRHRAFAFCINPATGFNHLREIMPDSYTVGGDTDGTITSVVRTRSMDFQSEMNEKMLYGGDVWVADVQQKTDFTVTYRSDQVPDFSPWGAFSAAPTDGVIQGDAEISVPGFKPRASLPKPSDDADEANTNRLSRRFFEIQAEIAWTGRAAVRKFRVQAQRLLEDSKAKV